MGVGHMRTKRLQRCLLVILLLVGPSVSARPQTRDDWNVGVWVYEACLNQYHSLPWWRRMWYRHDGNCKRYLRDPWAEM